MPKLDSDLKYYYLTIEETMVQIKYIQYSAIGNALVFLYKKGIFTS